MIILDRKGFDEIEQMVEGCGRLLVLGCDTCSAMCFTEGSARWKSWRLPIRMKRKMFRRYR